MSEANTYADLEIRILEKQERGYPVEITFNRDQEFPRGFLDGAAPPVDSASPQESGRRLFQWLFGAPELTAAWAQARGRYPLRRVRLRIDSTAPELHAIPWEMLCDPGDGSARHTLAAMESTPFSRYLAGEWLPGSPIVKRPIRILAAVAEPSNFADYRLTPIDGEAEWRILQDAVGNNPNVELSRLSGPCTLNAIEAALRKGVHILYLVAHGQFFGDHSVLYLAKEDNRVAVVKDAALASMMARQLRDADAAQDDKLRLVHLSSCHTAARSASDALRGMAPKLVECGVPAVIAMQDAVPVPVAQVFSRTFYRELLDHGEVDRAANAARCSLLTSEMSGAAIPVLFMRLRYGQIFANPRFGVFLAYNPADSAAAGELASQLLDAGVPPWFDQWRLAPGTSWKDAIEGALDESSAIAVLMGPGGLPPWQNEQVRMAIDRRARNSNGALRIVPILLPGARREQRSKLPPFLVSTTWVEFGDSLSNDTAFYRLLCGVRGAEPGAQPGEAVVLTGNPYRGLEYFDVDHQDYFFGREALIEWLVDALRTQPGASENRFLALIGPSGSGKSSLARAGLLAAMRGGALPGSSSWPVAVLRPGPDPLASLAVAIAPHIGAPTLPADIRAQSDEFRRNERAVAMSACVACRPDPGCRLVILVDQFEETFTQCADEGARRAFVDNLMVAANEPGGQTVVVLTLRADFYGECSAHPLLAAALSDHQVLVGPMQQSELRLAIERPALLAGAEFERGLVNTILDDVRGEPGCLPLLEDTLLALWQRREGRKLTHAAYEALGRVEGAIERRAEESFANLSEAEQETLRQIFLRLVQSVEGGGSARRLVPIEELLPAGRKPELVNRVIAKLAAPNVRLLTVQAQGVVEYVDIAHEALIRNWPRLQAWMNEDQECQLWLKRLNASRREWDRTLRHPDGLLRGALLDEAKRWFELRKADLNRDETDFIEAGIFVQQMREDEAAEQERKLEQERQRRLEAETERAHAEALRADAQARAAARLRKLAMTLAGLLIAVLGAGGIAMWQRMVANRERARSYSMNLASLSETIADPDLRVLLALHSAAVFDSPEAETALQTAIQAQRAPRFYAVGQSYRVMAIAAAPDGKYVATANDDDTLTFWNAVDRTRIGAPIKIDGGVAGIAFRRDGVLAVGTGRGTVRMIDHDGNVKEMEIPMSKQEVKAVAMSPDSSLLASGNQDGSVGLWRFPAGPLQLLEGHTAPIQAAAFSPKDGQYLVTADGSGVAIAWNTVSGKSECKMTSQDSFPFTAAALTADGKLAVTGDASGAIRVWEMPGGRMLDAQHHQATKKIEAVATSGNGRTVVSAAGGLLRFWDLARDGKLRDRLAVPCGDARCAVLAFLADGHTLAAAGKNGEVRLYETDFGKLFDDARNTLDPRQLNPEDCRKYLLEKTCDAPRELRLN